VSNLITDERFLRLIPELLWNEGVHANDPDDPGGDTWFGITRRSYPDIPWPPTREQAIDIYYGDWWVRYGYARIADDELAGELLDLAPNMGASQAHKLLQRACTKTKWTLLQDDGVLGPLSIAAINSHPNVWWLTDRFRLEAIKFYGGLNKSKYLASWVRRALT